MNAQAIPAPAAASAEGAAARAEGDGMRQWLRLAVGEASYALPIDRVREILQVGRLTTLPLVPEVIRGVMNLRGSVVPVIDLGARLEGRVTEVGRRSCIIVVEVPGPGADAPPLVAGMMVDAVYEVMSVESTDISAAPSIGTRIAPEYLTGITRNQGRMTHLLDIERALASSALTELVAAHAG